MTALPQKTGWKACPTKSCCISKIKSYIVNIFRKHGTIMQKQNIICTCLLLLCFCSPLHALDPQLEYSTYLGGSDHEGMDLIDGGAIYNTSGVALVSITDAVDSLLVVKDLIYDKKELDFPTLIKALADDFENGHSNLLAKINQVPKFGSDEPGTREVAQDLMDFAYDLYQAQDNYRGGKYTTGYWSISYHVGFGMLSGALPSGTTGVGF